MPIMRDKNVVRSGQRKKPFQPAIGMAFDGVQEVEAKNRGFLLRIVALTTVSGVAAAGGHGLITNDYGPAHLGLGHRGTVRRRDGGVLLWAAKE
jgi:hypothetical protein